MAPQALKYNMETIPALGVVAVRITKAAERAEHHFKMLNEDGTPVSYGSRPPDCGVRGYEVSKGTIVPVRSDLLEKAAKVRDQVLHMLNWVPTSALEDMVFDGKSYVVSPEKNKNARDVFALYHDTLADAKMVAVGTFVLKTKEYCFVLRPTANRLLFMQTFHYPADVRGSTEYAYDAPKYAKAEIRKMAEIMKLMGIMGDYDPAKFVNEVYEREQAVIDAAVRNETPVLAEVPGDTAAAIAVDITRQIEESLAALKDAKAQVS